MPSEAAPRPPLSVLDLAIVNRGATSADALAATTEVARRADALGYHRFWVAEHHNMPSVASTSPPVLMAHLAATTERIRIGSGGIMLPNHAPFVVAEHIAALEALHPNRIDLGLGRAPGTDQATAAVLRRTTSAQAIDDFPGDVVDLLGLLGLVRHEGGLWERFVATPAATTSPQVLLLGSSGYSAQVSALLGLPYVFAHHFDTGGTLEALEIYRSRFRPSSMLDKPHVIVTANVVVASTDEEARHQAGPGKVMIGGIRTGRFEPLVDPAEAARRLGDRPASRVPLSMASNRIVGSPETAVARLDELTGATGADELMVSTVVHGLDARLRSFDLLAKAWATPPA